MTVGVFLKIPVPGKVKTRLCPPLRPLEAAELYTALLLDSLDGMARSAASRILLFYDGPPPREYLPPTALGDPSLSLEEVPQRGEGLGARLDAAVTDAAGMDGMPLLLVGSDHPDLPPGLVNEALAALDENDLVLGPAPDGGTWGIGVKQPVVGLFDDIPWSSSTTAKSLATAATSLGLTCTWVSPWADVDDLADLRSLWHRVREHPESAVRSARWLSNWNQRSTYLEGK